ncbi:hypothetical protein Rhopal_003962-T1 [Rhodotorula paludigena]|uniref:Uncharacterized protein n=1 Tax=Rhodotorula paludigena TaxID=86838 RepID=A0AAV5GL63_9BASI|nr:hypothetical protein Rhopal_003962-T1 [Rhodotorula paludigena]
MQFPKAKRFTDRPPDSIPPPGAYDPHSPQQLYKKGAMLERASRFGADHDPNKPDTFGLYTEAADKENAKPRARTTSALATGSSLDRERHKQQLEDLRARLTASHEKDLAKLRAKVDKLEEARTEWRKERDEGAKERETLKSENRHLTSKLSRSTALTAKYESTLPSLQAKLATLTSQHTASLAKKDAELASLTTERDALLVRAQAAEDERDDWARIARRERLGREEQASLASAAVRSARDEASLARVEELAAARLRNVRLSRALEDRKAVVASLGEYARDLEERLARADDERTEAESREWAIREAWRAERELVVGPARDEKEWRQRARADAREVAALRDEVERGEREQDVEREWDGVRAEWEKRREKAWAHERKALLRDYEVVEGELDVAVNDEIPRLEALLAASEASLSSTHDDLATSSAQITALESDLAALEQRRADEAEQFEGEIEEQKRLVADAKRDVERERAEKRRVVGILAQTRASEGALKEEVESLNNEITTLTPLLAANDALQNTIDHLARLNAASEAEAQELIAQNSELVGHGNQNQKIRHVAMIREELAESRKKHLATLSSLAAANQRVAALEDELNSYRAVSAPSAPAFSLAASTLAPSGPAPVVRSRVSRPQVADALGASAPPSAPPPRATAAPLAAPPPPPQLVVHPAHDTPANSGAPLFSRSAAAASTTALSRSAALRPEDDAPLLPPTLAKSQPAQPSPALAGAGRRYGTVGAAAAAAGRKRRQSTSVKMEGPMTVSELFE